MKKSIVCFLMFSSIGPALAESGSPEQFVGRYKIAAETCPMFAYSNIERAYVKVQDAVQEGAKELLIQFYGDDAASDSILLGHGSGQAPFTAIDVHGQVTETWVQSWVDAKTLRSVTTVYRPSIDYAGYSIKTLQLKEDDKTVVYTEESGGANQAAIKECTLTKDPRD